MPNGKSYYRTVPRHSDNYLRYRVFLTDDKNQYLSAFHDVPLKDRDGNFNMVVEMSRGAVHEARVNAAEALNPIAVVMQKSLHGAPGPRNGAKLAFTDGRSLPWNQGAIPQTMVHQNSFDKWSKQIGNGGQIIVIEIGSRNWSSGQVVAVKVLYAYATIIDLYQTEWIVVAIAADDHDAARLNGYNDVIVSFKSLVLDIEEWMRRTNRVVAMKMPIVGITIDAMIDEKNKDWEKMQKHNGWNNHGVKLTNTTLNNSSTVTQDEAFEIVNKS